MKYLETSEH